MTAEQKKALLLLKFIIFNYHGLDVEEKKILQKDAQDIDGMKDLEWVEEFVAKDENTSFERAREFFRQTIATYDVDTKVSYLNIVWESTRTKGYISEMEATAILKLAKDWSVQKELLKLIRK
ncbi:MAG TPA: hypothetical protein VNW99_05120 [Cytophagaceae bacterium]|nr:hypothetical protein [Cytophagaceae bacterium]